jgi:hypothetical protein
MSDLILNVKKEWFDLIKSGKKKREYREIKPYWDKRLGDKDYRNVIIVCGYPKVRDETNTIAFPYKGYILTSVSPHEVSYDETIHTLNITEPEFVYAILLEPR